MNAWHDEVRSRVEFYREACAHLGSPLYALLLGRVVDDISEGGPAWEILAEFEGEPSDSALPLRFMAAVHRLVLRGDAPGLARHYPSAGGSPGSDAWDEFREVLKSQAQAVAQHTAEPMQTNEVGRSAALVAGLTTVAASSTPRIRLFELGASSGLNLAWDRYRFEAPNRCLGPPDSPVLFSSEFTKPLPEGPDPVVVERRGCDPSPLDPSSEEDRLTLQAATWADQRERIDRLRAALVLNRENPPLVDSARAGDWLEQRLAEPTTADCTVVWHSIVWQYIPEAEQARILATLDRYGRAHGNLHHLALDRAGLLADLTLTSWPGGEPRVVARAGYHGDPVETV